MSVKRINLNLDIDLLAKIDSFAEELHINRTSCISVILSQYFTSKETLNTMNKMIDIYDKENKNI